MPTLFDYNTRTAEQIEQALKTVMLAQVPEITDLENDVFGKGLKIHAGIAEMLHYYIDNQARESNIESAQLFSSCVLLARADDYRVRSRKPFEVVVTFTLSAVAPSPILIPKDTVVENDSGLSYTTIANTTIPTGQTQASVTALQQIQFSNQNIGTTNGQASQVLEISEKLVDGSLRLSIGAEVYTPVETFYYSLPTNTAFVQTVNTKGKNDIILGDGVNGKIPTTNQTIFADYALTEGEDGKVLANTLTTIISNITLPLGFTLSCNNLLDASGGKDRDSVTDIKRNAKALNRTVETAITRETYISLGQLIQGVAKVGLKYEYGNTVDIYVIPDGGGIATPSLLASVEAYYATRKIILTKVRASSAGEVRVLLDINVTLRANAIRILVEQGIKEALANFGSLENQEIGGRIVSGTINQLVCNVVGVETCILSVFSLIPYPRPFGTTSIDLDWSVEMLEGSTSKKDWRIVFITASTFQLFRDSNFIGVFAVGSDVVQPEIKLTVSQNYSGGDTWTFSTYEYLGSKSGFYQLEEPAILRIYENDITLTMTGGI
jgi:Baseplate J-like protein